MRNECGRVMGFNDHKVRAQDVQEGGYRVGYVRLQKLCLKWSSEMGSDSNESGTEEPKTKSRAVEMVEQLQQ